MQNKNNSNNIDPKYNISNETKEYIIHNLIEPLYKNEIEQMIKGKDCWKSTGITFETISKVMVAIGGVISFSSGYFGSTSLSFIAGTISTLSLALLQFSGFSFIQHKKNIVELNNILKKLDIVDIPNLTRNPLDIPANAKTNTDEDIKEEDIKEEDIKEEYIKQEYIKQEDNKYNLSDSHNILIDDYNELKLNLEKSEKLSAALMSKYNEAKLLNDNLTNELRKKEENINQKNNEHRLLSESCVRFTEK
jgi:hypothetical protein